MMPEPLLEPFTNKGKEVSLYFLGFVLELKARTERAPWNQWGVVL